MQEFLYERVVFTTGKLLEGGGIARESPTFRSKLSKPSRIANALTA